VILTAPDDRSFPNGPSFAKGDPVDVAELAAVLGVDAGALGESLVEQGWPKAKAAAAKKAAAKKAPTKTDPAPAGDDTTPDKGDDTEES
jgi:hypothetical protein